MNFKITNLNAKKEPAAQAGVTALQAPQAPKRSPKFLVQGDSNRLRY